MAIFALFTSERTAEAASGGRGKSPRVIVYSHFTYDVSVSPPIICSAA